MNRILFALMVLTSIPVWADMQTDMINDRLDRLDREMTLMQKKVYTADPAKGEGSALAPSGQLADVYTQLEDQNRMIADLTRRLEEMAHEQAVLKENLQKLNADVDVRFQEQSKSIEPAVKKNATAKMTDKEAYDAAYDLLMKAKYPEAEKAFSDFLKNYPDSNLVGNANYWLGETYYVRGQYDVAAGIFSDGLTKYEKSTKAPDNLLKLGLTMTRLNKKEEACGFFKLMADKYPKAGETLKQRAKQEAKKLSCP